MKNNSQNPILIKNRENLFEGVPIEKSLTQTVNPHYGKKYLPIFDNSFWDIKQASEKLNVSEKTLRDWVYKRQIPFKKVGKLVRFNPLEIHSWIEKRSKHGY